MSESNEEDSGSAHKSVSSKLSGFFKHELQKGKEGLLKGKMELVHMLGLGPRPNVVPPAEPSIHGEPRDVEIGWHPVAGFGGKWFAENTGLGKAITEHTHHYPDPTQHWAVLIGDYAHQLWMDEHLDIIYINEKINREEWHTYQVGKTRFNDEALRQGAEMVIHNMRSKKAAYNLISNNCQNFAVLLLDAIQVGAHREFGTAFAVYQRATGKGTIQDLFVETPTETAEIEQPETEPHETVENAKKVMDENTTKLDNHRTLFSVEV